MSAMSASASAVCSEPIAGVPLRSVELFGGAGGLALGLHVAEFDPVAIIENDRDCCETLRANAKHHHNATVDLLVREQSVVAFKYSEIGPVDLLAAGGPCQPFSHGGQRRGSLDERNLFPQVVRALHDVQPTAFVIENVRGLLFRDMELYFKRLLRELRAPRRHYASSGHSRRGRPADEYKIFFRVLNAADFGLPQNRQRLFIVGLRPKLADRWAWPEPTHSRDALIQALLADEYWDAHGVPQKVRRRVRAAIPEAARKRLNTTGENWRTLRGLLSDLDPPARNVATATDPAHVFVPDARLYPKHTGSKLDWPAKTVKAGVHGCPGGEHIVVFDNGKHRYFTVRECALLQGFPKDYVFPKLRTKAMRQIGNAVPIPVAGAVGRQLAEVLRSGES